MIYQFFVEFNLKYNFPAKIFIGKFWCFSKGSKLPSVIEELKSDELALSSFGGCLSYLRELKLDHELVSMKNFKKYDPLQSSKNFSLFLIIFK